MFCFIFQICTINKILNKYEIDLASDENLEEIFYDISYTVSYIITSDMNKLPPLINITHRTPLL